MAVFDLDDVTILIDGEEFTSWPSLDIHTAMDSISMVGFNAPFEPERLVFRETFRPFQFKSVILNITGSEGTADPGNPQKVFDGTLIDVSPDVDPNKSEVLVSSYALPGVLQDSNIPTSDLPTEFGGVKLDLLAELLLRPFSVSALHDADPGTAFEKVHLDIERKIFDFLSDLARQRNQVISNTADGELLFQQSAPVGKPVARLKDNEQPLLSVIPAFSPQEYFSEITGFVAYRKRRKGKPRRKASIFTVKNERLPGVLRPLNFLLNDTESADAPAAVNAKMGRMFANMAAYSAEVATWRDPQGELWSDNTTINLLAPSAMIYTETEFLIRTVTLHQTASRQTATLGLVLPGAFSGEIPETLPWEE